jgi:DNA uptake protein ComE-like DNA-binding protein
MNRFFEFSSNQLRVILLLTAVMVILSLVYFIRSFSETDEKGFDLQVNIVDEDQRYLPPFILDLNHSPADSLELLPGIGPVLAARIIAFRDTARFETVEDILNIEGIGFKAYEKMKPYLEVQPW